MKPGSDEVKLFRCLYHAFIVKKNRNYDKPLRISYSPTGTETGAILLNLMNVSF
ncbi:MAG: hypothetical protein WCI20_11440 [bacterium]